MENHSFKLQGELCFATVLAWRERGLDYLKQVAQPEFDFAEVTKADSAGVALLLEWWREATRLQKKVQWQSLPQGMQALMKVSNLDGVIG